MTKRQLLIVDEAEFAHALASLLSRLGYEVAGIATSGDEALAMAAQVAPALVLAGLALGEGLGSLDMAHELRRRGVISVLFMIDPTDSTAVRDAAMAEPDGYVMKPFADGELRAGVELALCRHDAARAVDELADRFFATSIDMLCFLDFNGHFKRLNPAWERTLGFTRAELMSKPFIEFVHPDDRERTLKQNAAVRGGGQALAFENRYLCKDGSYRWLRWNAAPDIPGQVIYSAARDVTASRKAEEEREQLVRELQSALAEVKTLREILPICSYCKNIRDDENYWHTVESYISRHTATRFSHGICPGCMASQVEPQLAELERE